MYFYQTKLLSGIFFLLFFLLSTRPFFAYYTGISASTVIGQGSFTSGNANQGGIGANNLNGPSDAIISGTKLIVSDTGNNRILIYNTIPNSPNASADIVIGQSGFSTTTSNQGGGPLANTLFSPIGIALNADSRFIIADNGNNRILNFNKIPTKNNVSADSVIGQTNFTANSIPTLSTASTITPFGVAFDQQGKLYASDTTNTRILIYDSVPAANGVNADIVIGQTDFVSNGPFLSANGLQNPEFMSITGNQLYVGDQGYNRVLVYTDAPSPASLSLASNPEGQPDGFLQELSGTATVNTNYTVKDVEYSVNNGTWNVAQPSDGLFNDDSTEPFYIDFDPIANNNTLAGYTLRVRSFNNNGDVTANAFHFDPFQIVSPSNNDFITTSYPTFVFTINQQTQLMKENLSKFQLQIRLVNKTTWTTYVDNIPVVFASVATNADNIHAAAYKNQNPSTGDYENNFFTAGYTESGSNISVQAKEAQAVSFTKGGKALGSGAYKWRVLAYDNAGNVQTSPDEGLFRVNSNSVTVDNSFFPLSLLYITSLGNINFSSIHPGAIEDTYHISTLVPTFYGIAPKDAQITLQMLDTSCTETVENCTKTYTTTANPNSRFGINVGSGDLTSGKTYNIALSASLNANYVELPPFNIQLGNTDASESAGFLSTQNKDTTNQSSMKLPDAIAHYLYVSLPTQRYNQSYCGLLFCI